MFIRARGLALMQSRGMSLGLAYFLRRFVRVSYLSFVSRHVTRYRAVLSGASPTSRSHILFLTCVAYQRIGTTVNKQKS